MRCSILSILLKHTSGCIATLSNKTTIWVKILIAPSESKFFFLKHDGFENSIYVETLKKKIKLDFIAFCFILLCTSLMVSLLCWFNWHIDESEWKKIIQRQNLPSNLSAKRGAYFITTESSSRNAACSIAQILSDWLPTITFR